MNALALPVGRAEAASAPHIYTRSDWGARPPRRAATVLSTPPDRIVVHHTVSSNSRDYSARHAAALSRSIQRFHMDTNGWDDTGQQFTIGRGGHIMEGRNRSLAAVLERRHVVGAHTANENGHTVGIENEGTYISAAPTGALYRSLIELCAWLCAVYGLDPQHAIVGHRDYNATACPGDVLYAMLPQLRNDVARIGDLRRLRVRDVGDGPDRESRVPQVARPERPSGGVVRPYDHGPAVGPEDPTL
ncbi:MAG: N-acetylmuramoyl-L-alanine amidase [Streptosporangiales bacterium]|nr:N-acetylmuramoyl-L-alanine amidase [Streptosporangiales bacterium]